jgi:hypothetical protein
MGQALQSTASQQGASYHHCIYFHPFHLRFPQQFSSLNMTIILSTASYNRCPGNEIFIEHLIKNKANISHTTALGIHIYKCIPNL